MGGPSVPTERLGEVGEDVLDEIGDALATLAGPAGDQIAEPRGAEVVGRAPHPVPRLRERQRARAQDRGRVATLLQAEPQPADRGVWVDQNLGAAAGRW